MWLLALLGTAVAVTVNTGGSSNALQADEDSVSLIPSKVECDLNEEITVGYQRVEIVRDASEKNDFVGLYRKNDPTTLVVYDVAMLGESAQTGEVKITCKRAGDMEVRMVRSSKIIGRTAISVYGHCPRPDCSGHGSCVRGICDCDDGWDGDGCELLAGEGLSIGWLDNPKGQFYPGDDMRIKVAHSKTDAGGSGTDMVQLFSAKASGSPLQSIIMPLGETEVTLMMPSEPGVYLLRYVRGYDLEPIATSAEFSVYEPCIARCSYHGRCEKGKCICDAGFDREDCSRGPGMATVTVEGDAYIASILSVNFTRDETSGVLTDQDWLGVYKASDQTTDSPIYYGYAISQKVLDPDVKATITTNVTKGTVQLYMPVEAGDYVVKYVRADYAKYYTTPPFTVYNMCPNQCSKHGSCKKGKCVCEGGWAGEECAFGTGDFTVEITQPAGTTEFSEGDSITVAFSRPAGNNSDYDFIGVYAAKSANTSDQLFYYNYAVASDQTSDKAQQQGEVSLVLPTDGKMVLRYVNAYTLDAEVESSGFEVFPDCVSNCSGHGKCVRGKCECFVKWQGTDCGRGAGIIDITFPTGLPITMTDTKIGFKVHVKRPANHFHVGDFVALFPGDGPFDVESSFGYTYAKQEDDTDVYLIIDSTKFDALKSGSYVVKYFSPSHEELGQSAALTFRFE
jgi:hypothetical protein